MSDELNHEPRSNDMDEVTKNVFKFTPLIVGGLLVLFLLVSAFKAVVIIDGSEVGVVRTFGRIETEPLRQGPHVVIPWVQSVTKFNTQLGGQPVKAEAASKDLQNVTTEITVQHAIDGNVAPLALRGIGDMAKIDTDVIYPGIHESLKAVTAKYTAEELVTKRDAVKDEVVTALTAFINTTLEKKGLSNAILIANVAITDFRFSDEFNHSIEMKVKAEQQAHQAENELKRRRTEAEAAYIEKRKAADAQAYEIEQASKARADAIKREAEALAKNPDLIRLRATEKWDGNLPVFNGGQQPVPFINLPIDQLKK